MERVISDCLVQDPLNNGVSPIYELEPGELENKYCFINSSGNVEEGIIDHYKKIVVPLLDMDSDWKMSWRNEPPLMKSFLTKLLLRTAELSSLYMKNSSFQEALTLTKELFKNKIETTNIHMVLCSKKFKQDNLVYLSSNYLDRVFLSLEGIADNKLIALPDPEFVGALPLIDNKKFGAFAVPTNIVNIEF